jgi:NAD-dependent deacetylase
MVEDIKKLGSLLKKSQYSVVLTGAGMSTESGLPDFRSNSGLWKGQSPEVIASIEALRQRPEEFASFYRSRIEQLSNYSPNIGHECLTKWQRQGLVQQIITQNVDGFHQQAASHDVIELHGSLREVICQSCNRTYASESYLQDGGTQCFQCQGIIRPNVVLFGESLPQEAIAQAVVEAKKAELFIVMGSSLNVSPANILPIEAINEGALFLIINEGETALDDAAHLKIKGKIGEIIPLVEL